ncbi:MAG: FliA/WhiG family RNA polymerase sigma factor [Gemmatimonadota bacterium]
MAPSSPAVWNRYVETRDPEARAEILEQHLGLVHHAVRGIAGRVGDAVEYDDLLGAGTLGLVQALEAFDPDRGFAFTTFAMQRIRGAVLDQLRAADWRPRSARTRGRMIAAATVAVEQRSQRRAGATDVAKELGVELETYWEWKSAAESGGTVSLDATLGGNEERGPSLTELLTDERTPSPDHGTNSRDRSEILRSALQSLPEQQRLVLTLYYYEELTLRQIAEVLHVTESRISQVRSAAIKTLRARAAEDLA